MFNLIQTVDKPTHRCGHILHWILHKRDDEILQTTHVSHELTSYHFTMVRDLDLLLPTQPHRSSPKFSAQLTVVV